MPQGVIQFDEFALDCDRYELLRAGIPVRLERLPMELLILLVEKGGYLVTRKEIVERLWGDGVFLDTEHGINTAIRKLRSALRDNPEQSRLVETVTGIAEGAIAHGAHGYVPFLATFFAFILLSNLLGLIPGLVAPTGNLNTTTACALIVFITYHVIGARKVGIVAYLKHFAGPLLGAELFPNRLVDIAFKMVLVPLFFVIEMFSHLARPLSLALRLFGNMAGGHILLAVMFLLTIGMVGWTVSGSLGALGLDDDGDVVGLPQEVAEAREEVHHRAEGLVGEGKPAHVGENQRKV